MFISNKDVTPNEFQRNGTLQPDNNDYNNTIHPKPNLIPHCTMHKEEKGNVVLFQFETLLQHKEVLHFVSGRHGGYSKGPFQSLNMGFHVGDSDWNVLQNRKKLAAAMDLELDQLTFANQTHSSNVAMVDASHKGAGSHDLQTAFANTDGLVTNVPGICLCVQVADCVPVLLYDPHQRVVAALHAGWRGTLKNIAKAGIKAMMYNYGCNPAHILAAIGPSNGPCCYQVGEDVKQEALRSFGDIRQIISPASQEGKYIFNQWRANFLQLVDFGVKEEHIETTSLCSHCHPQHFFSSRFDKGHTGRYSAGIMLR